MCLQVLHPSHKESTDYIKHLENLAHEHTSVNLLGEETQVKWFQSKAVKKGLTPFLPVLISKSVSFSREVLPEVEAEHLVGGQQD